jgi:hypothetical protein
MNMNYFTLMHIIHYGIDSNTRKKQTKEYSIIHRDTDMPTHNDTITMHIIYMAIYSLLNNTEQYIYETDTDGILDIIALPDCISFVNIYIEDISIKSNLAVLSGRKVLSSRGVLSGLTGQFKGKELSNWPIHPLNTLLSIILSGLWVLSPYSE